MTTYYKAALLALFIFTATFAQAQHIVRTVPFAYTTPTNNDYVQRFANGIGYTPVDSFGIDGASLATPDTISWGNGNALYCYKIKTEAWDSATVSLSFYYDSTTAVPTSIDRGASVWLNPSVDWNHYLITSVTHDKRLELLTYSWTNSPGVLLPLQHGHWYDLKITTQFIPGFAGWMFTAAAYVFDLGTDGAQTPTLIGMDSGSANDEVLPTDSSISVSISGSRAGGVTFLDNLYFNALPNADSCEVIIDTTTNGIFNVYDNGIRYQLNGNILRVHTQVNNNVVVCDALGRAIHQVVAENNETIIDLTRYHQGVYLLSVQTATGVKSAKFVLRQ